MTRARKILIAACALGLIVGCSSTDSGTPTGTQGSSAATTPTGESGDATASANPAQEVAIDQLIEDEMASRHLRAVIVKVSVDGKPIIRKAYGESMTGVPATTDMHFRNGAVAIRTSPTCCSSWSTRRR